MALPASHSMQSWPSLTAVWGLLWRGILFFPFGVLLLFIFCIACAGTMALAILAVAFAFFQQWWLFAGCFLGLILSVYGWRWYFRPSKANPDCDKDQGGILV